MAQTTGHIVCIADRDQVIAATGVAKKELQDKPISKQLEHLMSEREVLITGKDGRNMIPIISGQTEEYTSLVAQPIICEGDVIGVVAILSKDGRTQMGETEQKLAGVASGFLGRQMEN